MNDYSYLLYSEQSVLATDCYDLTPLTYEERGMLPAKKPAENGFIEETRFLFPGFIIIDCRANS
jgi:hypothetical protein